MTEIYEINNNGTSSYYTWEGTGTECYYNISDSTDFISSSSYEEGIEYETFYYEVDNFDLSLPSKPKQVFSKPINEVKKKQYLPILSTNKRLMSIRRLHNW